MSSPLSNQTRHWQGLDARHHLHPFTEHKALAQKGARVIVKAEGVWLTDSEGHDIIDGMAGLWCVQLGYGNEELAKAGCDALKVLPYYNAFFQTTTPYVAELSAKLAELTPDGLDRFSFANSGSEANDTAVKFIRYYWNLQGKPEKKIIISRKRGYHGVTMAAASLSGLQPMHPQADLPLPGFVHIDAPHWFAEGGDEDPEEFGLRIARQLEEKIAELGAGRVAAFFAEPVQGAGGLIIPPESYWPEIQRICKKHDILLVVDEVICGFGRTGSWFGSDTYGIAPDMMTMAKGLSSGYQPISAIALGPRVGEAMIEANEEWVHGFTYSGHPVAAAVALKNVEIMERDRLPEKVSGDTGAYFREKLEAFADHPLVGGVRSVGLLGAIELVEDRSSRRAYPPERGVGTICRDHCFEENVIMRAIGDTMVLSPPLVITPGEMDELFSRARKAIDRTAADLGLKVP